LELLRRVFPQGGFATLGFVLEHLWRSRASSARGEETPLRTANGFSAADFSAADFSAAGFSAADFSAAGFSAAPSVLAFVVS